MQVQCGVVSLLLVGVSAGYHLGAHRLGAGKETPYQEDIQVPFLIR